MIIYDRTTDESFEPVMLRLRPKRNLTLGEQAQCRAWFNGVAEGCISHDGMGCWFVPIRPKSMTRCEISVRIMNKRVWTATEYGRYRKWIKRVRGIARVILTGTDGLSAFRQSACYDRA